MNGYDLDNPLPLDDCIVCGFQNFDCICDAAKPYRRPTAEEVERARRDRLARAERGEA